MSGISVSEIAEVAHEANRALQRQLGEEVNPEWRDAPAWMKASLIQGVEGVLEGKDPAESHDQWVLTRVTAGWTLGSVKDTAAKQSPNLVPYDELPAIQRVKDHLLAGIVEAFRKA